MVHLKLISIFAVLSVASGYNAFGTNAFQSSAHITLLYENVNNGDGTYRHSYEAGNGFSAHESGALRANDPEGPPVTTEGGLSYTAPDGQKVSVSYTADENGFIAVGSSIPTPPPIPEAI